MGRPSHGNDSVRDMRDRLWVSIDNDDSTRMSDHRRRGPRGRANQILVAVADVDALVRRDSAIDGHASHNTTSVYTPAAIFPMLPEALSTDLTSLNEDQDRVTVVADMVFDADGSLATSDLYRARVRNHGKLAYKALRHGWMVERRRHGSLEVPGLDENLRIQDSVAQRLVELRHRRGALSLETTEANAVFDGDVLSDLDLDQKTGPSS